MIPLKAPSTDMSKNGHAATKKTFDPRPEFNLHRGLMKPLHKFDWAIASMVAITSAQGASVSVNLSTTDATTLITSFPYGIESSSVWNQGEAAGDTNVLNDSNVATTLDWSVGNPGNAFAPTDYNNTVIRFGDNAVAADTLTISQIPYANYKIIVYMAGATTLEQGSVAIGSTTYYYAGSDPANTSFIEITDTDSAGTPVAGNYAVFDSLSGASQTITYARQATTGAAAIIGGFQVVQVPEPGSLMMLGLGGLLLGVRRKR